jgi:8-oxo-(d)GTP phosphatase
MTVTGNTPWRPNDEVDEVRWITRDEAATLLSYEHDRRLVATVDAAPPGGTA